MSNALRRLGSSEVEGLLYRATIFVEGDDDVDLLETAFERLLIGYKLNDRGGKQEILKLYRAIQKAEKEGGPVGLCLVIFDKDEAPADLVNSTNARFLEWDRRCIENYLIDLEILTNLLRDPDVARAPIASESDTNKILQRLAIGQLNDFVARKVYEGYGFSDPGMRASEVEGEPSDEVARILFDRLERMKAELAGLSRDEWMTKFKNDCEAAHRAALPTWEVKWQEICDGKRLFVDLQREIPLKMSSPLV